MLTPQNPMGGDLPGMHQELADWLDEQVRQCNNRARLYLIDHPDEPGVIIEPVAVNSETGKEVRLEPLTYTRKDFGL